MDGEPVGRIDTVVVVGDVVERVAKGEESPAIGGCALRVVSVFESPARETVAGDHSSFGELFAAGEDPDC